MARFKNTVVLQEGKYFKQVKGRETKASFTTFQDKQVWFSLGHHQAMVRVIFHDKETTMDFIHEMRDLLDKLESQVSKH
tara:strand:- start:661 stop:897 length:237 start_codon:yes stop_codon:yes gene_type:complete